MKKRISIIWLLFLINVLFVGCSGRENVDTTILPDGIYIAEFDTDSSMFRVNEAYDGKGTLTVENGNMTIHVSLASQNIVNLYLGLAEDAKHENAILLKPTVDSVIYSDGWMDEVYGFDIPVPVLDEEFDVALIGKKGKWYNHKVVVSNPQLLDSTVVSTVDIKETKIDLEDGIYTIDIIFEGGSGKAEILSPAFLRVSGDTVIATLEWSSPNYDYMIVGKEKYLPINEGGNSVFEIPVPVFDEKISIIGDTIAMSKPHEIEYSITFCSDTIDEDK